MRYEYVVVDVGREAGLRGFQMAVDVVPAPGVYVGWGDFVIQLGNLVVIVVMIVLFALALVLPFPRGKGRK